MMRTRIEEIFTHVKVVFKQARLHGTSHDFLNAEVLLIGITIMLVTLTSFKIGKPELAWRPTAFNNIHVGGTHSKQLSSGGGWSITLSVENIRLTNMLQNGLPSARIEDGQGYGALAWIPFTGKPGYLDGVAAVLNGIQASGVPLERTNRMAGKGKQDAIYNGLWIDFNRGQTGIVIGATFESSNTMGRVPRTWWRVAGDGHISWGFSSVSTPQGNHPWHAILASDGIRNYGDRNVYLSVKGASGLVPIFIAYTGFTMQMLPDGSQIRVGTTPTAERPNPHGDGMVRFDEWLVHHVLGLSYGSMDQNFGPPARLHP
ncbi:MAG: hypothetical protein Q6373_022580, partial [Candidatus Sigynarchaeota archaeon]